MNKIGYDVKILDGFRKYHVKELQFADIQEIKSQEVIMKDSSAF